MIYLASNSPRRRELINKITVEFTVVIPSAEEMSGSDILTPEEIAIFNASQKATEVFNKTGIYVIGADTVVVLDNKIIGKPKDFDDAVQTLKLLRGRRHKVITGISVIGEKGEFIDACTSFVTINDISDEYINDYVKSGQAMDKAGSYGIQDKGDLVKSLMGDRDNVIGFPVNLIKKLLKKSGYKY